MRLIVGLGNPERAYAETRHNIGFRIVLAITAKYAADFHRASHVEGKLAQGNRNGEKIFFLLPQTYMNSSGESVKKCLKELELRPSGLLVVTDDADLAFGKIRLREAGSASGHHGLENIEQHLETRKYARLKIGIGKPNPGDLTPHVLGKFSPQEEAELPAIIDEALQFIEKWLDKTIEETGELDENANKASL